MALRRYVPSSQPAAGETTPLSPSVNSAPAASAASGGAGRGALATVGGFALLAVALGCAALGIGLAAQGTANNAVRDALVAQITANNATNATTTVAMVVVWVNAGPEGDDVANTGLNQTSPVKTIGRAMEILAQFSAKKGVVELDGTTPHDFGVDAELDFFPLIARYGNILIRGRRTNSHTSTVTATRLSTPYEVNPDSTDQFVEVEFADETTVAAGEYMTHVIQNVNTGRFFAVEGNTITRASVIGGNYNGLSQAAVWSVGDALDMFQVSTVVTWTGRLQALASFSRVWIEAVHFAPTTNTSQFVTPKYRDDAMIFHGCHFSVTGVASYDFGPVSETGLPLDADPRPLLRGSVHLEGCFVNGITTQDGVTPAAVLTTVEIDTKMVLLSVWSNATQIACSGACTVVGFLGTRCPRYTLAVATGLFNAHGLKFRGTPTEPSAVLIHVGVSTSAKIRNVDIDVAGGFIGVFLDAHSFGEVANVHMDAPLTQFGVRFGELTNYRLYNASITCLLPVSLQLLSSVDVFGPLNMTGTSFGTPLIVLGEQCRLHIGTVIPSYANHSAFNASIVSMDRADLFISVAAALHWSTSAGFPLISAQHKSAVAMPGAVTNENLANTEVLKCGDNAGGPAITQSDFASPNTQLCICHVFP